MSTPNAKDQLPKINLATLYEAPPTPEALGTITEDMGHQLINQLPSISTPKEIYDYSYGSTLQIKGQQVLSPHAQKDMLKRRDEAWRKSPIPSLPNQASNDAKLVFNAMIAAGQGYEIAYETLNEINKGGLTPDLQKRGWTGNDIQTTQKLLEAHDPQRQNNENTPVAAPQQTPDYKGSTIEQAYLQELKQAGLSDGAIKAMKDTAGILFSNPNLLGRSETFSPDFARQFARDSMIDIAATGITLDLAQRGFSPDDLTKIRQYEPNQKGMIEREGLNLSDHPDSQQLPPHDMRGHRGRSSRLRKEYPSSVESNYRRAPGGDMHSSPTNMVAASPGTPSALASPTMPS